jgi:hypothetical protein
MKKAISVVISFCEECKKGEFLTANEGGEIDNSVINYLWRKKLLTKTKKSVVLWVRVKKSERQEIR